MTAKPMTAKELDEMRARALCLDDDAARCAGGCIPTRDGTCHYLSNARAVREADEAAGLATVATVATMEMLVSMSEADKGPTAKYTNLMWEAAIAAGRIRECGE